MPMKNPPHPGGFVLRQCIEPLGLTITDAAAALGVTRTTLSELVNEKRGISPVMAVRLSKVFGGTDEGWLVQQAQYDLAHVRRDRLKLKRLELAVALANQPKLLLMDEPTAGMAPRERIELMKLTARIAREKSIGVLFTEHDMDVVFEHADRILVLNRGKLIAEGSPQQVRQNPEVRAIYLGEGLVYDPRHREGTPA